MGPAHRTTGEGRKKKEKEKKETNSPVNASRNQDVQSPIQATEGGADAFPPPAALSARLVPLSIALLLLLVAARKWKEKRSTSLAAQLA